MGTTQAAKAALAAGGYLTICGSAARYRHPQKKTSGRISLAKAQGLADGLELFACGAKWPFADWYRTPSNELSSKTRP